MARFEVMLKNREIEAVGDANAYQQEGQMTTFFRTDHQRGTVDSWSTRIASFRTSEILIIRRYDDTAEASHTSTTAEPPTPTPTLKLAR